MKTLNTTIKLYSFSELNEDAKQKAIQEHREFLLTVTFSEDFECLQDYYTTIKIYEHSDTNIIENIEVNEYLFFANGELADCTTYIGKHPKSGITELKFMGEVYAIVS